MKLLKMDMEARRRGLKAKIKASKELTRKVIKSVISEEKAAYRAKGAATKVELARLKVMDIAEEVALSKEGKAPRCDWYDPIRSGHIGSFRNAKRNKGDVQRARSKRPTRRRAIRSLI